MALWVSLDIHKVLFFKNESLTGVDEMKKMRVLMTRADLNNIPEYSLPEGFNLRLFKKGDQTEWARVETAAGEFESEEKALERFNEEFGAHLDEFEKRCLFLENPEGVVIGTTTGWYGKEEEWDEVIGRIHWVSIVPEYQGKGLAKPLLTGAMKIMAKYHERAYLSSRTTNYRALNMYRQHGFTPLVRNAYEEEAWGLVEEKLGRKLTE